MRCTASSPRSINRRTVLGETSSRLATASTSSSGSAREIAFSALIRRQSVFDKLPRCSGTLLRVDLGRGTAQPDVASVVADDRIAAIQVRAGAVGDRAAAQCAVRRPAPSDAEGLKAELDLSVRHSGGPLGASRPGRRALGYLSGDHRERRGGE